MHIGYIITVVFAVIWLGFKVYEEYKKNKKLRESAEKVAEVVKSYDTDLDNLIM